MKANVRGEKQEAKGAQNMKNFYLVAKEQFVEAARRKMINGGH